MGLLQDYIKNDKRAKRHLCMIFYGDMTGEFLGICYRQTIRKLNKWVENYEFITKNKRNTLPITNA